MAVKTVVGQKTYAGKTLLAGRGHCNEGIKREGNFTRLK